MRILVENYKIECFETEQDYKLWIADNASDKKLFAATIYHGPFYGIPQNIKNRFRDNLLVSIKSNCYTDTQYIIIHQ